MNSRAAKRLGQRLEPLTPGAIVALRAQYPGLPSDYLRVLENCGFGGVGGALHAPAFALYSGPIEPSLVLGAEAQSLDARYLIFGDELGGVFAAFDFGVGGDR